MEDINNSPTFGLLARPSFIEGIGRLIDFTNSLQAYNRSRTGTEADLKALAGDWRAIGQDIKVAIDRYGKEAQK